MNTHEISIRGVLQNKETQKPIAGMYIEVWDANLFFDTPMGGNITDQEGRFEINFKETHFLKLIFDRRPDLFFKVFYKSTLILSTEHEVVWNFEEPHESIVIGLDWPDTGIGGDAGTVGDGLYHIKGTVVNDKGVALNKVAVEAYVKTLDRDILVGKSQTNKGGAYALTFKGKAEEGAPDLQVKAYQDGTGQNQTLSAIRYNASKNEVIDITIATEKIVKLSEFENIKQDIEQNLGSLKLVDLKEDDNTQHISYLSNKTGWDARLTAMLIASFQLAQQLKVSPAHLYGLFRSGLSGSLEALSAISSANAELALKSALAQNVIPNNGSFEQTLKVLEDLSHRYLPDQKPYASVSSLSEMMELRLSDAQKNVFVQVYKQAGDDTEKLWSTLQEKGFAQETISKLQLDGKLGFLTGNNAPLMRKIYETHNINTAIDLVGAGLYKPDEWKKIIASEVPANITADEYALHMANHVKISYPTAVAGEMLRRAEIKLGDNVPTAELTRFFDLNQDKNTIGVHPVKNWEGFERLSVPAKAGVKTFERLYQISPSDEALNVLAGKGIHSAYQVTKYTPKEFLSAHGGSFPSIQEAKLTYTKAHEVTSTSVGIATAYLTQRGFPNMFAISGTLEKKPNTTIAYPTLEELFGNMDYCACDACKSVLSPAAYLVELLEFIDLEGITHHKSSPLQVLLNRRPDIQHIQLTCENTNVALPYIDLVNEILEHYILNGNLENLAGHDIDADTKQSTLLAEPQYVEKTAYEELKKKVYPYNLPFHRDLEVLRHLFRAWDTTLESALQVFSTPLASRKEALGFSDEEYLTITSLAHKTLGEYFGQAPDSTIAQLNVAVSNGKTFSRILDISYETLVTLLKTNFINPGYTQVSLFQKLKIDLLDLQKFYTGSLSEAQLDALIPKEVNPANYGGDIKAWLKTNQQAIMGLVVLTDISGQNTECNFAVVELRYALPDSTANQLTPITYHKFHRFKRLLLKTGWSIATLDQLLKVLLPKSAQELTEANIDENFKIVFDRLANFKKLANQLEFSEKRYAELVTILDDTLELSIRQEQCAKILKLNIPELVELSIFTGVDPFKEDLEADEPSLLKLVKIAQKLKSRGLKVVDLAYIMHHADLSGKLIPKEETLLKNIKILKDALNIIEKENSIAPDNADFAFAKNKMLLVYDAATTDTFFGLLQNTKTFTAPFATEEESLPQPLLLVDPNLSFDPFKKELIHAGVLSASLQTALNNAADGLIIDDMDAISTQAQLNAFVINFKASLVLINTNHVAFVSDELVLPTPLSSIDANLSYNATSHLLTYTGIWSDAIANTLKVAANSLTLADMTVVATQGQLDAFKTDFKTAVDTMVKASHTDLLSLAANWPDLKSIYDLVIVEGTPAAQAQKLVSLILPEYKKSLKINALRQVLSSVLKVDADVALVLTGKKEVLASIGNPAEPLWFDFVQLEEKLVFDQNKSYQFYIDVPLSDDYLFYVNAPQGALVTLKIDGQVVINAVTVGNDLEVKNATALSLKGGGLKAIVLTIEGLSSGEKAHVLWRTKGMAKTIVPDAVLYGKDRVDIAQKALVKLAKAAQLQSLFKFTPLELSYLAADNIETKGLFNDLDVDGSIVADDLKVLWQKIALLISFDDLKKENEPEDNTWLQVLIDPSSKNAQGELLLESFNLWKTTDVEKILEFFGLNRVDLSKLSIIKKVKEAMDLVAQTGYSALEVKTWANHDPSYEMIQEVKVAIKQKNTEAVWLETLQSVSDPVRNLLRDALVSFVLQYKKPSPEIINADKLYEYFLIDVQMDACMKTSRIRQALSTVQLFIQRCLINLEPMVDPASIRAEQWAWMKRYRVWEANRKVFLFPENWLEPELRDNKSFLFKELEGELLQGEITDESAELAYLNYLKKLDDIAKLEIVGMYLEEKIASEQNDDILHVFGRTNGNTRQYYYRSYEAGYWNPWEKVSLNIEGEHLFPIVWRGRLFVFWLNIVEKAAPASSNVTPVSLGGQNWGGYAKKNVEVNICWGEYYKGKWTSPKSTDLKRPIFFNDVKDFNSNELMMFGRTDTVENPTGKFRERVVFNIAYGNLRAKMTFTSKNAAPYLEYVDDAELMNKVGYFNYDLFWKAYGNAPSANVSRFNMQLLMAGKEFSVNIAQPAKAAKVEQKEKLLTKKAALTNGFSVLPLRHPVQNQFEAPFSYADEHSTFFVQPDEELTIAIQRHQGYYPTFEIPFITVPELVEKPIIDKIRNPGEDRMDVWESMQREFLVTNPNYTKMLPNETVFTYLGNEFGAGGKNINVNTTTHTK